jgi:hypothetical protein
METLRLRQIQHPSEVERLLQLFIASRSLLPEAPTRSGNSTKSRASFAGS